jgi:hypothetical protein
MCSPYRLQAVSSLKIIACPLLYCKARANSLFFATIGAAATMKII